MHRRVLVRIVLVVEAPAVRRLAAPAVRIAAGHSTEAAERALAADVAAVLARCKLEGHLPWLNN